MSLDIHVVRKGKACPSAAAITEVAADPQRIDLTLCRHPEHGLQHPGPGTGRVTQIVDNASI